MATERECASYELVKGSLHRAFTRVRGAVYDFAGVARYRVLLGSQMVCRAAADELAVCVSDDADNLSLQRLRLGAACAAVAAAEQYPHAACLRSAERKAAAAGQLVLRRGRSRVPCQLSVLSASILLPTVSLFPTENSSKAFLL